MVQIHSRLVISVKKLVTFITLPHIHFDNIQKIAKKKPIFKLIYSAITTRINLWDFYTYLEVNIMSVLKTFLDMFSPTLLYQQKGTFLMENIYSTPKIK